MSLETKPCRVCNGTGKTYLEHPDGALSEEVCPYCHGRANSVWVRERGEAKVARTYLVKMGICFYGGLIAWPIPIWTADTQLKVIHFVLWLVLFVGFAWIYVHPSPKKARRRGPNPLTTDRERWAATGLAAGAFIKHDLDQRFPKSR